MKNYLTLLALVLISHFTYSVTVSNTYNAGDISTNNTTYSATCNGPITPLTVALPAGGPWIVSGVEVDYDMTAASGAWMSEQRSKIYCQNTTTGEAIYTAGSGGSSAGTESYNRAGLAIANGTYAGGTNLTFEMQAYRTWTGAGTCNTTYNKIDNGTWTITVTYTLAAAMTFVSSTTTQNNIADIILCGGAANQEIIGVEVVTTGSLTPLNVQRIRIQTNGSTDPTNDISNIDIYYTGTSSTFATTTLFGSDVPLAAGVNIPINATQTLAEGTNYFWIVYDVLAAATIGNNLDALCNRVRVSGTNYVPTVQAPAGDRDIDNCPGSPGGVNTNIVFWLKADEGLTTTGANVTGWADQSTASTAVTVNGSPDEVAVGRNYNPTLDWTKSNGVDGGDWLRTADVKVQSYFTVAQLTDVTRVATHIVTYDQVTFAGPCPQCATHGGNNGGFAGYGQPGYGNANFESAGVWRTNGNPTGVTNLTLHSGDFDIVTSLGGGDSDANTFLGGQVDNLPSFNGRVRDWFGPVGEMVVYSGAITTTEANKIESYLAIKYGITLGGNGSTTLAYASSVGSSLWAANSGYHNDVIGIGRDDTQELVQKQSQTPDDSSRIYISTLTASNQLNTGTFTNDVGYILAGHDVGNLCSTTAAGLEKPAGLYSRLEREWMVKNTNLSDNFNFDVTLNACANPTLVNTGHLRLLVDLDGDFSNATVYAAGGGLSFSYSGNTISVTGISTTHIPLNATRYITIASTDIATPLPVELTHFDVNCNGDYPVLSWTTASEINNDYFNIERSTNAINFEPIGTVNGSGNSNLINSYSWTDDSGISGATYYRLKQTDFNGAFQYHEVKSVSCEQETEISIYPNPFENSFTIQLSEKTNYPITVEIIDYLGRTVHSQVIENTIIEILLDEKISKGTYFVKVITEKTQLVKRIVKMK